MAAGSTPESPREAKKGIWFAIVAMLFVGVMVVFVPPARWFLAISIPIGVLFAVILYFWNRRRPVKLDERHNKRPLGLD